MGHNTEYKPEEVINDFTNAVSKVWDNVMPSSYPYVLEFKTNKVVEVKQIKRMGPYSLTEHFFDYDVDVIVDKTPLENIGWDEGEKISKELTTEAYGENYFYDMRDRMRELLKYVGLNISNFDFGGTLNAKTN